MFFKCLIILFGLTASLQAQIINDPGFELPIQGAGKFSYKPSSPPWIFSSSAGIATNNSGFTTGNPVAPEGSQVAFIQGTASFTQVVSNVTAGTYQLTVNAAQRAQHQATKQDFQILIDDSVISTFTPTDSTYKTYTTPSFTVTDGSHFITFKTLNTSDNTVLIDQIVSGNPGFVISDPGFEQIKIVVNQFQYRPNGSPWTFGTQAGLSGNGSLFTPGNPNAPQGNQVAFIQGISSLTQTVPDWLNGSYQLTFYAAQRAGSQSSRQDFQILIDNSIIGTFNPASTTYLQYVSPPFNVNTGTHSITFKTLNSAGGDNTVFIDSISTVVTGSIPAKSIANAVVATSGKMISFSFNNLVDNTSVLPAQIIIPPTLIVNGQTIGQLGTQWLTGYHPVALLSTPNNYQIRPNDIVKISAPVSWAVSYVGMVKELNGLLIENRTSKPMLAKENFSKKLRIGVNNNQFPPSSGLGLYFPLQNYRYRVGINNNRGKFINPPWTNSIDYHAAYNSVDDTQYPGVAGLWLVMWDATNPANPTQFKITTQTPTQCTVAERVDLARAPPNGVGMCRVFDVEPIIGAAHASFDISLNYSDAGWVGKPNYDNLWIVQPGDWSIVNGQVVLDRSDPFAISPFYLQRIGSNIGSMRWVDSTISGGNPAFNSYPEYLSNATDESWGPGSCIREVRGYTLASPVDTNVTPWIYSPFFKKSTEQFTATLGVDVTTAPASGTYETWTITDGATAPLMAGLELSIDGEICRVLRGSDTSWVVHRGSNGTTPVPHIAGPLSVSGRRSILNHLPATGSNPHQQSVQLTFQIPHRRTTGTPCTFGGTGWPILSFSDGSTWNLQNTGTWMYVTGPNTFFTTAYTPTAGGTLTKSYPLNPALQKWELISQGGIPYETIANITGKFPYADLHVNIPIDSCDDMVYEIAKRILANFPSGRRVYVEYSNEPWNWAFSGFTYHMAIIGPLVAPPMPGYVLNHYAFRAGQVHDIFRKVFDKVGRKSEIQGLLNCQMGNGSSQVTPGLEYGLKQNTPFDVIAIAPYWSTEDTPYNQQTASKLDDEQFIDVINADQRTNPKWNNSWINDTNNAINTYNQAHSAKVKLIGYEGGIDTPVPGKVNDRRGHDIIYNPNWYYVEQDWLAMCQGYGFDRLNIYCHCMWWNPAGWGIYHTNQQRPGRGDGLNGGNNNLLIKNKTKPPLVNQDMHMDSVRGQAYLDWLGTLTP